MVTTSFHAEKQQNKPMKNKLRNLNILTMNFESKRLPGWRKSLTKSAPTVVKLNEPSVWLVVDGGMEGEVGEQDHLVVGIVEINRFISAEFGRSGRTRRD
jgi:hypothetical protein